VPGTRIPTFRRVSARTDRRSALEIPRYIRMSALRPRNTRGIRELNWKLRSRLARAASSRINSRHSRATWSRSARVATGSSEGITDELRVDRAPIPHETSVQSALPSRRIRLGAQITAAIRQIGTRELGLSGKLRKIKGEKDFRSPVSPCRSARCLSDRRFHRTLRIPFA